MGKRSMPVGKDLLPVRKTAENMGILQKPQKDGLA
jgi:hypothetical protein